MNTVGPYHNRQETYAYFSLPFCQGILLDQKKRSYSEKTLNHNQCLPIMIFHIILGPKQTISHYHETLGEALQGTELEFSGLEIEFKGKHMIFLFIL